MTSIRKAALASVATALLVLPFSAAAQGLRNQDTFFTFSQPVELPNKTLPAGTYLFQLMDSPSNRHIVKVMSQDRKEIHTTLMAIPFYSNDRPSDQPQVRFMETPAQAAGGGANAIKIWFYPGTTVGHEFIYPRSQAMRIAARTQQPVLTTKSETEVVDTVADDDLSRVDRSGTDSAVSVEARTETTADVTPEPEASATATAQVQEPRTTSAPMPERTTDSARTTDRARTDLPNTASFLPLLALIGIGSLVGSRWLRRSRRV